MLCTQFVSIFYIQFESITSCCFYHFLRIDRCEHDRYECCSRILRIHNFISTKPTPYVSFSNAFFASIHKRSIRTTQQESQDCYSLFVSIQYWSIRSTSAYPPYQCKVHWFEVNFMRLSVQSISIAIKPKSSNPSYLIDTNTSFVPCWSIRTPSIWSDADRYETYRYEVWQTLIDANSIDSNHYHRYEVHRYEQVFTYFDPSISRTYELRSYWKLKHSLS